MIAAIWSGVRLAPMFCRLDVIPAKVVPPILLSMDFCASLSRDISLLVYRYPPVAFTWGRYLVRADFLTLAAISCLTRATAICLLPLRAIARQLSSVSTRCATPPEGMLAAAMASSNIALFLIYLC